VGWFAWDLKAWAYIHEYAGVWCKREAEVFKPRLLFKVDERKYGRYSQAFMRA
jgi:hypothetical protein